MENKRKTLKGFTLVELLIVLALFSIIMSLVISFIEPVTNMMSSTSIKERTAAYSDNINEYIENSLRYASNIYVYDGGLPDASPVIDDYCEYKNPSEVPRPDNEELTAIMSLIYKNFDGAVYKYDYTDPADNTVKSKVVPVSGKVRVLKFLNDEGGRVLESTYNFKAGNTYPDFEDPADESNPIPKEEQRKKDPANAGDINIDDVIVKIEVSGISGLQDVSVLNPDSFKYYNYYYKFGNYELKGDDNITTIKSKTDPDSDAKEYSDYQYVHWVSDDTNPAGGTLTYEPISNISNVASNKYYYLTAMDRVTQSFGVRNFPVNVIAYANDFKSTLSHVSAQNSAGDTVDFFKAPAHMDTTTFSVANARSGAVIGERSGERYMDYYRIMYKRKSVPIAEGSSEKKTVLVPKEFTDEDGNETGKIVYTSVETDPVEMFTSDKNNNVYVVFILPYELDSKM